MAQQIRSTRTQPAVAAPTAMQAGVAWQGLLVLSVFVISIGLRVALVWGYDFPLNDGGFTLQSVEAVLQSDFRYPVSLSYNTFDIPFAQPPLTFYLLAGIHQLTGIPVLTLMRWYPVIMSSLALPMLYMLMLRYFQLQRRALLGLLAFVAMPTSVFGVLIGSGAVPATGMFFGVAALWQAIWLYQTKKYRYLPLTAVFIAAAMMSELRWGMFTLISVAVLFLSGERTLSSYGQVGILAVLTAVLSIPWFYIVIQAHSAAPYNTLFFNLLAFFAPFSFISQAGGALTLEPAFAILYVLILLGGFLALTRGYFNLLAWNIVALFIMADAAIVVTAVPLSFLVALALDYLILNGLSSFRQQRPNQPTEQDWSWAAAVARVAVVLLVVYPLLYPLFTQRIEGNPALLPIDISQRAAMAWVREETPADATFVLMSDAVRYDRDGVAEWFPSLAQRRSYNTAKGREWIAEGYIAELEHYETLKQCQNQRIVCIEQWAQSYSKPYTHVWFDPHMHGLLSETMRNNSNYELVYEVDGILIFSR